MKVLNLFFDMIRPEFVVNGQAGQCLFDFLEDVGGELYNNCYTPAPDTTRSIACYWSGVEPKKNSCDVREKWPKYYLNQRFSNLIQSLKKNEIQFNFFHEPNEVEVGILPRNAAESDIFRNYDLKEFISTCKPLKNSFTYIGIQDFHISFNSHGYDDWGVCKAFDDLAPTLILLKEFIKNNNFDHIFIFSDHGFLTDEERLNPGNYLSKKRNQILLFHHAAAEKKRKSLRINNKFCSIMALRPSVEELFEITSTCDDYAIWSPKVRNDIYVEDHHSYQPCVNHSFEYWGVIKKSGKFVSCTLNDVYIDGLIIPNDSKMAEEIRSDLSQNTSYANYAEQDLAIERHREWLKKSRNNNVLSTNRKAGSASIFRKARRMLVSLKPSIRK